MDVHSIKIDLEHAEALKRMEELSSAKPGTPEGAELESLIICLERYQKARSQIWPSAVVDEKALEALWKKGAEAWKNVESATEWVEKLRGNS
jgi:hypothetical protein